MRGRLERTSVWAIVPATASAGYPVAEQARQSAGTIRFVRWGVTPLYREPAKKESALKKAREVIAVGEIDPTQPVRFKSRRWVLSFLDRPTPV
ncbi:MAG: hypothetical protein E6I89_16715 [Chloroflexi bacterium]|nr:MAG: hypothetical protein E6I89_16715 [Chloroflexota bacterium]